MSRWTVALTWCLCLARDVVWETMTEEPMMWDRCCRVESQENGQEVWPSKNPDTGWDCPITGEDAGWDSTAKESESKVLLPRGRISGWSQSWPMGGQGL